MIYEIRGVLNIDSDNYSISKDRFESMIPLHLLLSNVMFFQNDMFEELLKSIRLEVICVIFPCDLPIFCN